jgi:hypothetical protein
MRSHGPRVDPETGALHARVNQAHDYELATILWRRRIGNGTLTCKLFRARSGPARRIIQLEAAYTDAGVTSTLVSQVNDPLEEQFVAARMEREILAASARPDLSPAPPPTPE